MLVRGAGIISGLLEAVLLDSTTPVTSTNMVQATYNLSLETSLSVTTN